MTWPIKFRIKLEELVIRATLKLWYQTLAAGGE